MDYIISLTNPPHVAYYHPNDCEPEEYALRAGQETASPTERAGRAGRGRMDRGVARRQCRAGVAPVIQAQ